MERRKKETELILCGEIKQRNVIELARTRERNIITRKAWMMETRESRSLTRGEERITRLSERDTKAHMPHIVWKAWLHILYIYSTVNMPPPHSKKFIARKIRSHLIHFHASKVFR